MDKDQKQQQQKMKQQQTEKDQTQKMDQQEKETGAKEIGEVKTVEIEQQVVVAWSQQTVAPVQTGTSLRQIQRVQPVDSASRQLHLQAAVEEAGIVEEEIGRKEGKALETVRVEA